MNIDRLHVTKRLGAMSYVSFVASSSGTVIFQATAISKPNKHFADFGYGPSGTPHPFLRLDVPS